MRNEDLKTGKAEKWKFTDDDLKIIEFYFQNDQKELKKIVNQILDKNFPWVTDREEFESLAGYWIGKLLQDYDGERDFRGYLYSVLQKKFMSRITYDNRYKRNNITKDKDGKKQIIANVSLDAPVGDKGDTTYKETLSSNIDCFEDISMTPQMEKYWNTLSDTQRKIARMKMEGYDINEICQELKLSKNQCNKFINDMKSYEKKKHLLRDSEIGTDRKEEWYEMGEIATTTSEKTKNTSYSIESICKKLKKHTLRDDHVLQRESGQWKPKAKSELISDIMQGKSLTQIIISEEIKNGITMHWLIDGKQRCGTCDEFVHDGFPINNAVQRYIIGYQAFEKDEDGKDILNEEGFPISVIKTCDIRKKKFSQLPEELQEKILDYQIPVMLNLNCTKKEIAYDIARFNRSRPMTVAQNGWTGLDEEYAEYVHNILKMKFFQVDCKTSDYKQTSITNGMMRRMIIEAIITSNYIENFNKDFRKMCEFLNEEANDSTFINFYAMIEQLSQIKDESLAEIFKIKDSFIWFAMFDKFLNAGLGNEDFVRFVKAFNMELKDKEIDGMTYTEISNFTKDKTIVIKKMKHLTTLMNEFFDIEPENTDEVIKENFEENPSPNEEVIITEFDTNDEFNTYATEIINTDIMNVVGIPTGSDVDRIAAQCMMAITDNITDFSDESIQEFINNGNYNKDTVGDVALYLDTLNEWSLEISGSSNLLKTEYIPALVRLVKYTYDNDTDKEVIEWFKIYANRIDISGNIQKDFEFMKHSFDEFLKSTEKKIA